VKPQKYVTNEMKKKKIRNQTFISQNTGQLINLYQKITVHFRKNACKTTRTISIVVSKAGTKYHRISGTELNTKPI